MHLAFFAQASRPWGQASLQELFREYVAAKQRQNVLDYDDLLLSYPKIRQATFAELEDISA